MVPVDLGLSGRRAAVAASSAGLGFAAARALTSEGVTVAVNGRDQGRLDAAADALGGDTVAVRADVGGPDGAAGFVAAAREQLGGIDILVANAGGPPPGTFSSSSIDDYRAALDLNLMSIIAMCEEAVPAMRRQRWGRVVAITSVAARQPVPFLITSTTARAGATGFLKVLATEVAPEGVTVNSVQPGSHATSRLRSLRGEDVEALRRDIPVGFIGDPDDFGAVCAFVCSEQARFITGAAIPVEGGASRALM